MPESYVTSAEIDRKNIVLTVNVDSFTPGEYVEISGCATQAYETQGEGGFATFSEIQEIKKNKTDKPVALKVKAKLTKPFQQNQDITVVVRVAKVWITVLSDPPLASGVQPSIAGQGWAWGQVEGVGGPDEYSSAAAGAGQAAAAGSSAPPTG